MKLTNNTKGAVSVAGIDFKKGESKTVSFVNNEIIEAVEVDKILLSDTDLTPLAGSAIAPTSTPSVTSVSGTAVVPASGVLAIAAVTDTASTANAVKTIAAEMTRQNADIAAIATQQGKMLTMLLRHEDLLFRSTNN